MAILQNTITFDANYKLQTSSNNSFYRLLNGWLVSATIESGTGHICIQVSTNGGDSFSLKYKITTQSSYVSVAVIDNKIHISYKTVVDGYIKTKLIDIVNEPINLNMTDDSLRGKISANTGCITSIYDKSRDFVWVIYYIGYSVYYSQQKLDGTILNSNVTIQSDSWLFKSDMACAFDGNNNLYLVYNTYYSDEDGNGYAVRFTYYNGTSWSSSRDVAMGTHATSGMSGSDVDIVINSKNRVFVCYRYDTSSIVYVKYTDDKGVSWVSSTSSGTSIIPSLQIGYNDELYFVYGYFETSIYNLYYKKSVDDGVTWNTQIKLSNSTTTIDTSVPLKGSNIKFTSPVVLYSSSSATGVGAKIVGQYSSSSFTQTNENLGDIIALNKVYNIINSDSENLNITEYINGNVYSNYSISDVAYQKNVTLSDIWNSLPLGKNVFKVVFNTNELIWTFTKIYGTNSKPNEMISALLDLTGINQKAELKTALTTKGLSIADSDGIADMIGKLNGLELGKKWASGSTTHATIPIGAYGTYNYSVSGLTFKPSYIIIHWQKTSYPTTFKTVATFMFNSSTNYFEGGNGQFYISGSSSVDNVVMMGSKTFPSNIVGNTNFNIPLFTHGYSNSVTYNEGYTIYWYAFE